MIAVGLDLSRFLWPQELQMRAGRRRIPALAETTEFHHNSRMSDVISSLESSEDLETHWKDSFRKPLFLLKHSLVCGTSFAALEQFLSFAEKARERAGFAILEIQTHRNLSREVEERTGVRHQSPQVLLVSEGKVSWTASHWSISSSKLEEALLAVAN